MTAIKTRITGVPAITVYPGDFIYINDSGEWKVKSNNDSPIGVVVSVEKGQTAFETYADITIQTLNGQIKEFPLVVYEKKDRFQLIMEEG